MRTIREFEYNAKEKRFQNIETKEKFGFYSFLKALNEKEYRKLAMQYNIPLPLELIGNASRVKVFKLVQLHFNPNPPINDFILDLTSFMFQLQHYYKIDYKITQQINACYWAINDYERLDIATSLLFYCGQTPTMNIPNKYFAIHRITSDNNGITIEIDYPHTIQERFRNGLRKLQQTLPSETQEYILERAMQGFYSYDNWLITIPSDLHSKIEKLYQDYIEKVHCNAFGERYTPELIIEENIEWVEPQTIYLPYNEFIKSGVSTAQITQRQNNAKESCRKAIVDKISKLPKREDNTYKTSELNGARITARSINTAVKYGLLEKIKHGVYKIMV